MPEDASLFKATIVERVRRLKPQILDCLHRAHAQDRTLMEDGALDTLRIALCGEALTEDFSNSARSFSKGCILDLGALASLSAGELLALPLPPQARVHQQQAHDLIKRIGTIFRDREEVLAEASIVGWTRTEGTLLALLEDERIKARIAEIVAGGTPKPTFDPLPRTGEI